MSEPFCKEEEDEEWTTSCRDTEDTELRDPDRSSSESTEELDWTRTEPEPEQDRTGAKPGLEQDWTRSEEDMLRQPCTEETPVRDEGRRLPELCCDLWLLRRDPSGIV